MNHGRLQQQNEENSKLRLLKQRTQASSLLSLKVLVLSNKGNQVGGNGLALKEGSRSLY